MGVAFSSYRMHGIKAKIQIMGVNEAYKLRECVLSWSSRCRELRKQDFDVAPYLLRHGDLPGNHLFQDILA